MAPIMPGWLYMGSTTAQVASLTAAHLKSRGFEVRGIRRQDVYFMYYRRGVCGTWQQRMAVEANLVGHGDVPMQTTLS